MPIKSYILIPRQNQLQLLTREIAGLEGCNVHPAENKEVLVLVTDTRNDETDKTLLGQIEASKHLQHISLVAGFN